MSGDRAVTLWELLALAALADVREIGRKCESRDCIEVAHWRCFWPAQTCFKCTRCRDWLAEVGRAMGLDLHSEPCDVRVFYPDDSAERFAAMELR